MGVLVGGAVAIAGGAAGGAAAGAVKQAIGGDQIAGVDTSVPGVSSATIKKGGKGRPDITVPQIDITQSLEWFKQAASVQESAYREGLDYYNAALTQAAKEIKVGFENANNTLKPLSYASTSALNEQMKMLGLDPISSSHGMAEHAKDIGLSEGIQNQIRNAEDIQDPQQREASLNQINQQISQEASQNNIPGAASFLNDYNETYSKTYQKGYTGQEVTDKLEATPGYQFQMDQGTKAIERQGAAKGMLGSGNTLASLTQYGQGLAQNYYGMYMDNLSKIVMEGSPATMQIASNKAAEGTAYAGLTELGGQAGMKASSAIGDAKAQSLYQSGNLYAQTAQANAQLQYKGIQTENLKTSQLQQQAIASGPAYMNASLANAQFNYGVFQNQQGGAAYAQQAYNPNPYGIKA